MQKEFQERPRSKYGTGMEEVWRRYGESMEEAGTCLCQVITFTVYKLLQIPENFKRKFKARHQDASCSET